MNVDCDILVVGLGPVGDVLAGLAALEGLHVVAVDRDAAPYPLPRAAVFDDEIMRIFQSLGVAERLQQVCRVPDCYEFVSADDEVLLDFHVRDLPTLSGWQGSYVLHQPAVEAALRERLQELAVDVRLGQRLLALDQDDMAVTATLTDGAREYQLRARYVVGADGASSTVRQAIGGTLHDYQFDEPWLVIDAMAPDSAGLPSRMLQICDPRRPSTYLKMTGDRYRWEFMILPGETVDQVMDDGFVRHLLTTWGATGVDGITIERKAVYRFHGLVAHNWRAGRVLLAGDAAHQMPPFAGQGMCSGIRDSGNLAWKLGAVVRGDADPDLLDSYQAERDPHVRAIIETAINMGRIICLLDPDAASARNAEMLARRASGIQELSMRYPDLTGGCLDSSPAAGALFPQQMDGAVRMDDVLGRKAWLIGRNMPQDQMLPAGLSAFDLRSDIMRPYADAIGQWLDMHGVDAVLVRPDHHIFGTGTAKDLLARYTRALSSSRSMAA